MNGASLGYTSNFSKREMWEEMIFELVEMYKALIDNLEKVRIIK